jgi:transposase
VRIARRGAGAPRRRPAAFDPARYRDTVERCLHKLTQSGAVATRFDKRRLSYESTIDVASIRIWLRGPVPRSTRQALNVLRLK